MRKITPFLFGLGLSILPNMQAHACFVAPEYLENEFGSDGVSLGDFSETAEKIMIGRFVKRKSGNLNFRPSEYIKTNESKSHLQDIHFSNVKKSHLYLYVGQDDNQYKSFPDLKEFISDFQIKWLVEPPAHDLVRYGFGGPIAGIWHGTDCERLVVLYRYQDYLIYLDERNTVLASFPINREDNSFSENATILSTNESTK